MSNVPRLYENSVTTVSLFGKKNDLEIDALAFTPSSIELSGRWFAEFELDGQRLAGLVTLNQTGTYVVGTWQFKLASLHPILIRGVLCEDRLIATQFRPHKNGLGSGTIDATLDSASGDLLGVATWYDDRERDGLQFDLRLIRGNAASGPSKRNGEPADASE